MADTKTAADLKKELLAKQNEEAIAARRVVAQQILDKVAKRITGKLGDAVTDAAISEAGRLIHIAASYRVRNLQFLNDTLAKIK